MNTIPDVCPECGHELHYDPGTDGGPFEAPIPASYFCDNSTGCGLACEGVSYPAPSPKELRDAHDEAVATGN